MGIFFEKESKIFHLQAHNTSYVMKIFGKDILTHLYWGKKIQSSNLSFLLRFYMMFKKQDRCFSPQTDASDPKSSLDTIPQEYPAYGNTDFRTPAFQVQLENGSSVTDLRYNSHKIIKGKPSLEGLPATYVENQDEAETLEIELIDSLINLKVVLSYTVYEKSNVIARSVRFLNKGKKNLKLLRALSMSIDFHDADYDFMHLYGGWSNEMNIERRPLMKGNQSVQSRRGASSPQHNPFIVLLRRDAGEDKNDVYGFSLVYSGNFIAQVEVDQFETARVSLGINPFDFSWLLEPGESFQTPEVVLVYSDEGLGKMSRTYHRLYRTRLCRGKFRDKVRPVVLNTWEAVYDDVNTETILELAKLAKGIGIEILMQDYGWTINTNKDTIPIGDWIEDKKKFPEGLKYVAKKIQNMGIQFGLWMEPENVSSNSNFYKENPDWVIHIPDRNRSEAIGRLVLDLSRQEVCDEIIKIVSEILSEVPVNFVRWDMNRHMTEIGSASLPPERQRETAHRYILGLYRVMNEITSAFPHILFEGCSGGGGRFDPGILYYMPQILKSDNTDPIDCLKIQNGASIVYPISSIENFIAPAPNFLSGRITSLKMRGHASMCGVMCYYLDLRKLTNDDKKLVKNHIVAYKEIRKTIQFGNFYRLNDYYNNNIIAWNYVSDDKKEAFLAYFQIIKKPNEPLRRIKIKGLNPRYNYKTRELDKEDNNEIYSGEVLMNIGLNIPKLCGDFQSVIWRLKAIR